MSEEPRECNRFSLAVARARIRSIRRGGSRIDDGRRAPVLFLSPLFEGVPGSLCHRVRSAREANGASVVENRHRLPFFAMSTQHGEASKTEPAIALARDVLLKRGHWHTTYGSTGPTGRRTMGSACQSRPLFGLRGRLARLGLGLGTAGDESRKSVTDYHGLSFIIMGATVVSSRKPNWPSDLRAASWMEHGRGRTTRPCAGLPALERCAAHARHFASFASEGVPVNLGLG
jgi:hypothetical protein